MAADTVLGSRTSAFLIFCRYYSFKLSPLHRSKFVLKVWDMLLLVSFLYQSFGLNQGDRKDKWPQ